MIIATVVTPKKIAINCSFIALLKITASGKLNAAVAIIKANAVPNGTPFLNKTIAIGTMAAQLPYIGTPIIVARGTEKGPVLLMSARIVSWGT